MNRRIQYAVNDDKQLMREILSFGGGMPQWQMAAPEEHDVEGGREQRGVFEGAGPQWQMVQAEGQFFHLQCIQSIEPIIPGKPLLSPMASNLAVSSSLGVLKYSSPKTSTTAQTNLRRLSIVVLSPIRT
jgi:hypothetical protein